MSDWIFLRREVTPWNIALITFHGIVNFAKLNSSRWEKLNEIPSFEEAERLFSRSSRSSLTMHSSRDENEEKRSKSFRERVRFSGGRQWHFLHSDFQKFITQQNGAWNDVIAGIFRVNWSQQCHWDSNRLSRIRGQNRKIDLTSSRVFPKCERREKTVEKCVKCFDAYKKKIK